MNEKLDKLFTDRYKNLFDHLNRNVVKTDPDTEGVMTIPVVEVGDGGAQVLPTGTGVFELSNNVAQVTVNTKQVKTFSVVYRLKVPLAEAEIAANKPEYFNFLMDNVVNTALIRYNATFGGPDISRFGAFYCTPIRPGGRGEIFRELENGEGVEIRLYGMWAGSEEVGNNEQGN